MTDFRHVAEVDVYKDDVLSGKLARTDRGTAFTYDPSYLASGGQPLARHLPARQSPIETRGIANLHSYFAGLLPEGVMLDILLRRIRCSRDDLFAILAASGSDAIGDVTVRRPGDPPPSFTFSLDQLDLQALIEARDVPSIAAIPGAQPKLSVGSLMRMTRIRTPRKAFIAKAPPRDFPGLVENEELAMKAARMSGIRAASVKVFKGCLVVTRFDREYDSASRRLRQIHTEDALQLADRYPAEKYSLEYREIADLFYDITGSKAVVLGLIELYAFSYIVGNGDLHAKNVSLMISPETRRWILTPAYDIVSTLPYKEVLWGAERMALALEDECFGQFTLEDFVKFGRRYSIPDGVVRKSLGRIASKVSSWLPGVESLPYSRDVIDWMRKIIVSRARALSP